MSEPDARPRREERAVADSQVYERELVSYRKAIAGAARRLLPVDGKEGSRQASSSSLEPRGRPR